MSLAFQALLAQIENFTDPTGLHGANITADFLIDGAIWGASTIVGVAMFTFITGDTMGLGAPLGAAAGVAASAGTSAFLNYAVERLNVRSNLTEILSASQIAPSNPPLAISVPSPFSTYGTPCPDGC